MSKIHTGAFLPAQECYENADYSRAVPGVIYQFRQSGAVIRVERDGKGDHVTLVRDYGMIYQIVASSGGVVGKCGFSHSSQTYVADEAGRLDFSARDGVRHYGRTVAECSTMNELIGEIGLRWIS